MKLNMLSVRLSESCLQIEVGKLNNYGDYNNIEV